jgi:integrative and conjugative element protein (TIGR02256 family)
MLQIELNLPSGGFLLIEPNVISVIESFIQSTTSAPEGTGILIGEYRENDHIRVVEATCPGAEDRRSRYRFNRISPHHKQYALQCWKGSNKVQTWIGEWHTHPEDHPKPSALDFQQWAKHLPERTMVLIIQGRLSRWVGISKAKKIISLTLTPT